MEEEDLLDEISALEAIYGDGIRVETREGILPRLRIIVRSENEGAISPLLSLSFIHP
jgi:hypothetical protein